MIIEQFCHSATVTNAKKLLGILFVVIPDLVWFFFEFLNLGSLDLRSLDPWSSGDLQVCNDGL